MTYVSRRENHNPFITPVQSNTQCINCGVRGHIFKECSEPTTSFGIIAYRYAKKGSYVGPITTRYLKQCNKHIGDTDQCKRLVKDEPIYLMVQRKDTFGYIEFVRGRYIEAEDPQAMIRTYVSEMTCDERYRLMNWNFDQIWKMLWVNHNSKCYRNEYKTAREYFNKINIREIINDIPCQYSYPEYGFPKGRRILNESDEACALREFCEETGYKPSQVDIVKDQEPICELFTGTNNRRYKNIFYLAHIKDSHGGPKLNFESFHQSGEISNIAWLPIEDAKCRMRKYDHTKIDILNAVHDCVCGRLGIPTSK